MFDETLDSYVAAHRRQLLRIAWLLCGEWTAAEDLVQVALTKTWSRWSGTDGPDSLDAYVRQVIVRMFISSRRARRWPSAAGEVADAAAPLEDRDGLMDLRRALATLTPRQRLVLTLRYFADLSVIDTAAALGCSEGTVKSQTSKAIAKVRRHLALPASSTPPPSPTDQSEHSIGESRA